MTDAWGVLSETPDGTTAVTFERRYAATPAERWDAVPRPERVARWLGPLYGDLAVGGRYELRMGDDVPGSDENATGEILACDPPHRYEVSWVFPSEQVTYVSVEVRQDGDAAVLLLTHRGLEAP